MLNMGIKGGVLSSDTTALNTSIGVQKTDNGVRKTNADAPNTDLGEKRPSSELKSRLFLNKS